MAEESNPPPQQEVPAAAQNISLSQAILAPLDAVFKAQLHAARSFLSMLLQLGYPHQPLGPDGLPVRGADGSWGDTPYYLEFANESLVNGERARNVIRVPALALVPVAPLAVQAAEFRFSMSVREIAPHRQMQESEDTEVKKDQKADAFSRPWFLVSDPVSIRGTLANDSPAEGAAQDGRIEIEVKIAAIPIPAGLDKLLTALTQASQLITPNG